MLSSQNTVPKKPRERGSDGEAERAIIDAESHAVYYAPEIPIGDGDAAMLVDGLLCLDHPGQEDSSANICACELFMALNQLTISKDAPSESLYCTE